MATFTFDGTSSITASKTDTVLISADPTTFTGATDNGSSVTLAFGSQSVTITNTNLAIGNLPNVFVTGGTFDYAGSTNPNGAGTGNVLAILNPDNGAFTLPAATTANSKVAVFGGLGRVDTIDGSDTISIGGKGTFLVFGNAGADTINQSGAAAFDSTSVVNVNGDLGNDKIDFSNTANAKASIFVGGGAGLDTIAVTNSGTTTIFGGLDSTDGADLIVFNAPGTVGATNFGAAGTVNIFGNGGADNILIGADTNGSVAGGVGLASGSTANVFGGAGDDGILVRSVGATDTVIGGEGKDSIFVTANGGNTFITGGNASGNQSQDSADQIVVTGSKGTLTIFGNLGDDTITADTLGDSTTISIFGGRDNDTIVQSNLTTTGKNSVFIAGGENNDTITAAGNGGAVTIYGGISNADATDGSDQINYGTVANGSTGTANIFANGGNDTVRIGVLGDDSVNTVTVYGGAGSDSISIASQKVAGVAATQQIVAIGGDGADTFTIAKGFGQTVTISDFSVSGGDLLNLTGTGGNAALKALSTTTTYQTLQQALDAASTTAGANGVAAVKFGNDTYVVAESAGNGTFTAATDQAIKLTGVTDPATLIAVTAITA